MACLSVIWLSHCCPENPRGIMLEYWAIFLIGFFSSFGHCIGMCGGFVVAYSLKLNSGHSARFHQLFHTLSPHLLYNLGRIFTYSMLGIIFGLVGEVTRVVVGMHKFQGVLQLVAGVLMIVIALEIGGWTPTHFSNNLPGYGVFKKVMGKFFQRLNRRNVFTLGLLNGLIPCGLVYAAGAKAASTGSIKEGMLTMLFFGLGTLPAMFAVGLSANMVSANFRSRVFKVATVLVFILGLFTVYRGYTHYITPLPASQGNIQINCVH